MAKKGFVRRVYKRASRRMTRATIPVMGVLAGGTLAASVLASSAGQPKPDDNPMKWLVDGKYNSAVTKLQFNLSKPSTYTPVVVPLVVWAVGRAVLGKVRLSRRVSLF